MAKALVLEVSEADRQGLQVLSRLRLRREAVRARAILLSLEGFTSQEIGLSLDAYPSAVREWRGRYVRGALRRGAITSRRGGPVPPVGRR